MFKYITSIALSAFMALSFSSLVSAAESGASESGKIVVYRAQEGAKTKKIRFNINIDQDSVGRIRSNRALVTEVAPGEYQLATSIGGGNTLPVTVKAGQTVYVFTKVSRLGDRIKPELILVEEKVAVAQQPAVANTI